MPDWKKIKAEYVRGGVSYRKLADKYSVSLSTLSKIAMKEKWADLRKQTRIKVDTKLTDSVASQEAKRVNEVQNIADLLLQKIKDGVLSGIFCEDTESIRRAVSSLKDLNEIKGYKSDLDIQEQKARIEKLRREAQTEDESKDIRVVISSELEDYST